MEVRLTLTAGMLIDQFAKHERALVTRALQTLEASNSWDDLPRQHIRQLKGGLSSQRLFSYRASNSLRVIFLVVGNTIHVLDVVRPDQIKNLRKRTSGSSSE